MICIKSEDFHTADNGSSPPLSPSRTIHWIPTQCIQQLCCCFHHLFAPTSKCLHTHADDIPLRWYNTFYSLTTKPPLPLENYTTSHFINEQDACSAVYPRLQAAEISFAHLVHSPPREWKASKRQKRHPLVKTLIIHPSQRRRNEHTLHKPYTNHTFPVHYQQEPPSLTSE